MCLFTISNLYNLSSISLASVQCCTGFHSEKVRGRHCCHGSSLSIPRLTFPAFMVRVAVASVLPSSCSNSVLATEQEKVASGWSSQVSRCRWNCKGRRGRPRGSQ